MRYRARCPSPPAPRNDLGSCSRTNVQRRDFDPPRMKQQNPEMNGAEWLGEPALSEPCLRTWRQQPVKTEPHQMSSTAQEKREHEICHHDARADQPYSMPSSWFEGSSRNSARRPPVPTRCATRVARVSMAPSEDVARSSGQASRLAFPLGSYIWAHSPLSYLLLVQPHVVSRRTPTS